jgi:hypothetical protein
VTYLFSEITISPFEDRTSQLAASGDSQVKLHHSLLVYRRVCSIAGAQVVLLKPVPGSALLGAFPPQTYTTDIS